MVTEYCGQVCRLAGATGFSNPGLDVACASCLGGIGAMSYDCFQDFCR
jgi:hypothetical protein